jgi:hypothetical protein
MERAGVRRCQVRLRGSDEDRIEWSNFIIALVSSPASLDN